MPDDDLPENAIRFDCPACGKRLRVPRSAAGKGGRCPKCDAPVVAPGFVVPADPPGVNVVVWSEGDEPPEKPEQRAEPVRPADRAPVYYHPPRADHTQMIVNAGICAGVGAVGLATLGYFVAQFSPVFGADVHVNAEPFSPARQLMVPAHLFAFGLVGLVLGGIGGAALAYLTAVGQPFSRRRWEE